MNRRKFFLGLGAAIAEPIVEAPIRRVYSFIWTPPEPRIETCVGSQADMEERIRTITERMRQDWNPGWHQMSPFVAGATMWAMASKVAR